MTREEAERRGAVAAAWWRELQPGAPREDRGALARLRRAALVRDAATEQETLTLCRRLGLGWQGLEGAALAAAVLAGVREDARAASAARQLGPDKDNRAAMSWLRFRRLLQAETGDDQLVAFRRAVALAGGRLNVLDLARSLLDWDDKRRQRWIYDYYAVPENAQPAPDGAAPALDGASEDTAA